MAVANRMSAKDRANKVFKPSPKETNKAKLSNFFPKDDIFNKTKTYRLKGRDEVQSLEAEWRNVSLSGYKIVLIKGCAVSKDELKHFPKDAKAYYLNEKKPAKAPAKPKEPVENKEDSSEKVD